MSRDDLPDGVPRSDLIAWWDFSEPAGTPRLSKGTPDPFPLEEVNGPIPRADGGPVSGFSADFDRTRYFRIPHARTDALNIHGRDAQVSLIAAIKLREMSTTVAGMWFEGEGRGDDTGTRQYALLLNMPTYGGRDNVVPHVSSEGGVTRRADGSTFPWCADYAANVSPVPVGTWCTVGMTYDGRYLRAYLNGTCEPRRLDPVADKRDDPYFTREGPGGGDRGMNPYYHGRGIYGYDPARHANRRPSDFTVGGRYALGGYRPEHVMDGLIGGLAVYDRALTAAEMAGLHRALSDAD